MNSFRDTKKWNKYLDYLEDFSKKQRDIIWIGLSPFTYGEWLFYYELKTKVKL